MAHDFVLLYQRGRDWIETSGNVETDVKLSKCIDHTFSNLIPIRVAVVKLTSTEYFQKYIFSQNIIVLLFISEFESIHIL